MRTPDINSTVDGPHPNPSSGEHDELRQEMTDTEVLLLALDGAASVVGCNNSVCRFLGHSRDELMGTPVSELLDSAGIELAARQAVSEGVGAAWSGTIPLRSAGGTPREVTWRLEPVVIGPARDCCAVLYGTEAGRNLLQAGKRAAENEAQLQAILETAVDGIVTIDDCGIIQSLNTATVRIFGYSFDELIGQNVEILMPDDYRGEHDRYISNYLNTGQRKIIGIGREVEGRRKDGSLFPLDLAISEFQVAGSRLFMGLMRDITSRKRAEQEARLHLDELAHASRLSALGEMATGIAHEVNQPLAAIVSYAQACLNLMSSENSDPAVVRNALEQIAAQGRRAGDIVHQLRQFVRKEQVERAPVDINKCIRNVLQLFSHDLRSSETVLDVELREDVPLVTAERVQVEQVALNLLRNALEAASQRKDSVARVKIETAQTNGRGVQVCVSDNGPGLRGEPSERLFETFYTTKPQGLGVGLSISRSIIESHGGNLRAEQNDAGGLNVIFTLPGNNSDE